MVEQNIKKLFETFANPVRIISESTSPYFANSYGFLQPLRYKNKMYVDTQMTEMGLDDDGRYVYIGLPTPLLTNNNTNDRIIEMGQQVFSVIRAENVIHRGKSVYVWAIIKRNRGGAYV